MIHAVRDLSIRRGALPGHFARLETGSTVEIAPRLSSTLEDLQRVDDKKKSQNAVGCANYWRAQNERSNELPGLRHFHLFFVVLTRVLLG